MNRASDSPFDLGKIAEEIKEWAPAVDVFEKAITW